MTLPTTLFILLLTCWVQATVGEDSTDTESPFRMHKINLLWHKALLKLTPNKLNRLRDELRLQDKEEWALKKLKSELGDKDGLREAQVRKKFVGIVNSYGLGWPSLVNSSQVETAGDERIFKDKKLDRLWNKAKMSGLEDEELMLLKKEFQHYQDKVDQFHHIKELSNVETNDMHLADVDDYDFSLHNELIADKAKELKENYDRLHRLSTNAHNREFQEPKVDGLWTLAQEADFDEEELESIRQELKHYQYRLQKLHKLKAEADLIEIRSEQFPSESNIDDEDLNKKINNKVKQLSSTVEQLHRTLSDKIATRHAEL